MALMDSISMMKFPLIESTSTLDNKNYSANEQGLQSNYSIISRCLVT